MALILCFHYQLKHHEIVHHRWDYHFQLLALLPMMRLLLMLDANSLLRQLSVIIQQFSVIFQCLPQYYVDVVALNLVVVNVFVYLLYYCCLHLSHLVVSVIYAIRALLTSTHLLVRLMYLAFVASPIMFHAFHCASISCQCYSSFTLTFPTSNSELPFSANFR